LAAKFNQPTLFIVAGAPGSGKSALMPVSSFGVDCFNADDEAAKLNGNSYKNIPIAVRGLINQRFERFILEHIEQGLSFALETTLRTPLALAQAALAREAGFYVVMNYIATESLEINLNRVAIRAEGGGHSAPPDVLESIRRSSYENLLKAINSVGQSLDELNIFDNSLDGHYMTQAFHVYRPTDRI
jgi:predicted ABC-type ATPase